MIRKARIAWTIAIVTSGLMGCSERIVFTREGVDQVVVDGILLVDEPMPEIWITRSQGPQDGVELTRDKLELLSALTVQGAEVFVVAERDTIRYRQYEITITTGQGGFTTLRGPYVPLEPVPLVRPTVRYDLEVRTPRGEVVRASTTTPPRLQVREWVLLDDDLNDVGTLGEFDDVAGSPYELPANKLKWGEGLLEARFDRDAGVRAFQVGLTSMDLESDFAITPDFFEEDDFDSIERQGSSPMFEAGDGKIRLPWFAVFFEGPYLVKVFATDSNWFDFVTTSPSLTAGNNFGGNAGDAFEPPIFNVEGGIGVFASGSVDSVGFCVYVDEADSVGCAPTRQGFRSRVSFHAVVPVPRAPASRTVAPMPLRR